MGEIFKIILYVERTSTYNVTNQKLPSLKTCVVFSLLKLSRSRTNLSKLHMINHSFMRNTILALPAADTPVIEVHLPQKGCKRKSKQHVCMLSKKTHGNVEGKILEPPLQGRKGKKNVSICYK